ncbi:Phage capsid and scaffold [Streptococcus sp. DD10]|nr:Phage capsid and scaffold [Streptococcus sp. DD10]
MLSEAGIVATDEILDFVVKDSAENTQETVNKFTTLVNNLADKKVSEMLKGKTPKKVEQSTTGGITKEQFSRMGYKSRNELLQNNPELYAQLAKG